MKDNVFDLLKGLFTDAKDWIRLELEYAKMTAAEKFTVLMTTLILGAVCFLIGLVALIIFSFALVEVFKLFLAPVFAYLCVGGFWLLVVLLLYLLRRPLILNPLARMISRVFIDMKF